MKTFLLNSFTQNSLDRFRQSLTQDGCIFTVDAILQNSEIMLEPSEDVVQNIVLNTVNACLAG